MLGSIDGDFGQIKSDQAVVAGKSLVNETFEHARRPPLVASTPQRCFGSFAESSGDVPRTAGNESEQERFEAFPIEEVPIPASAGERRFVTY